MEKTDQEKLRLSQAVEQASDGVIITDPNLPGNPIIYANETFVRITGYPLSETLGKGSRFLQGPKTDPKTLAEVDQAIAQGKGIKTAVLNYRKDGSAFWNGLRISPVYSPDGKKLLYFLGFLADITERIQMEESLMENNERFQKVISVTGTVVRDWNVATNTLDWSATFREAFRYEKKDIGGGLLSWYDRVHPEDLPSVRESMENAIKADKQFWSAEYRFRCGDGRYADIEDHAYIIRGADQKAVRIIGAMKDVSEKKKLQAQLLQAQKMETVGTLAGGIAHDLNNQLTPVKGYIDLIMLQVGKENSIYELLWEAEQAVGRCQEVVQRLLGFSRASNQQKSVINLAGILWELKNMLPQFLPSTISTEVYFDQELWLVHGNDTELQTVLMNLSANARDAMLNGGKLSITAKNLMLDEARAKEELKPGPYVVITIMDTGSGIPPDIISRIYEPFFTTKQKGQGTGLGLAMVFRIIRDHGGWIDVSSKVGEGTIFLIYLPAKPQMKMPDPKQPLSTVARGSETILFADDEETIRHLGKLFLERLGYKTILAQDGEEAVAIYKERYHEIGAVILDMTMPKLTGRQTLKKILEINSKAKIMLSSGYTSEGSSKELIREGAADFLQKPYTIGPLSQMLRKVLDS